MHSVFLLPGSIDLMIIPAMSATCGINIALSLKPDWAFRTSPSTVSRKTGVTGSG